jgi:hypothetical protein
MNYRQLEPQGLHSLLHERKACSYPFSRAREKVPAGRMRAPIARSRRLSSGAARHLLPLAGEGIAACIPRPGKGRIALGCGA